MPNQPKTQAPAARRALPLPVPEHGEPVGVIGKTDIIRAPLA